MFESELTIFLLLLGFELVTLLSSYLSMTTLSGKLHSFAFFNTLSIFSFMVFTILYFHSLHTAFFFLLLSGILFLRGAFLFREVVTD